MPLHNWNEVTGWDGVHHLWITELLRWVKPRLPEGYRAYIGSAPTVAVGAPRERPDVSVRRWAEEQGQPPTSAAEPGATETPLDEPDEEISVPALDASTALYIERQGRLVSAIELVPPRNKDRPVARATY